MNVPSVSIGLHDRYTPAIRDRILEKLQAPIDDDAYHLLTPAHLRTLAATESSDGPVLSLYLQLGPERRSRAGWHSVFSSLADETAKTIRDRRKRRVVRDELDRIENALNEELPELGRGVAFFACRTAGLRQQIPVSVPLPDGVHLGPQPYLRPLVRTRDEHDRFVLALLSQEHSRFFISQIGQVEEVLQVRGERPPRLLAERVALAQGSVAVAEPVKREGRVLAEAARLVLAWFEGRHLLTSAPPEMRAAFVHDLPKELQQWMGGNFAVDLHAGVGEVAAAAEPAIEAREERATLDRIFEAGPNGAAWGERRTLDALWERRVLTLAVEDTFCQPGSRCRRCESLSEQFPSECPTCGSEALEPVGDVVELALERALERRAALELVRSEAARHDAGARADGGPAALMPSDTRARVRCVWRGRWRCAVHARMAAA
jgi:peptide subunit release factor 1 (eRF1)